MNPLTPQDCDLRNFPFMPLDVVRLRDSDIAALSSGDEFRAAVLLWCAAWHQIPAASLPDDDQVLSVLAGYGRVVKEWKKVKANALRGWITCTDGRLYHPVVAEKANEAWASKLKQSWKTECARIKKHNERHPDEKLPYPTLDEYVSLATLKVCPEGQGASVPNLSPAKQHPTDTDTDRDISNTSPQRAPEEIEVETGASLTIPFVMHMRWKPSDSFVSLAKISGLVIDDKDVFDAAVGEFIAYWITQPKERTQGEWEHALIKSFKADKFRKNPASSKQSPSIRKPTVHDIRAKTANDMLHMFNQENANGRIIDVSECDANQTDRPALPANG